MLEYAPSRAGPLAQGFRAAFLLTAITFYHTLSMISSMNKTFDKLPTKQTVVDNSKQSAIHKMDKQPEEVPPVGIHLLKLQPHYTFTDGRWKENEQADPTTSPLSSHIKLKLITWNIDFQAVAGPHRMAAALHHLNDTFIHDSSSADTPFAIGFQEVTPSDLSIIQSTPWIQSRFRITDTSPTNWRSHYGTTTLVDLRLPLIAVFRTHYVSRMGRDALFVDLDCRDEGSGTDEKSRIRLGNTHLESLAADPPLRPAQVALASRVLNDGCVRGGVLMGDFNAIQDFDRTLHRENGLKDVFLEEGGMEGSEKEGGGERCEEGWTWGMQSPRGQREEFGCSRLDKMLFCRGVRLEGLRRIGRGVKVPEGEVAKGMLVTDHLGLVADLVIER